MIGFIKGEVVETRDNFVLIENNGIGYEVCVSNSTLARISANSSFVQLYTYLNVREDGLFLYGFYTSEEKQMFLKLITISGVGPKAAISILSGIEPSALAIAIISGDLKTLSKIKGIGKKTAERIILELRESIDAESAVLNNNDLIGVAPTSEPLSKDMMDAVSALCGLGIGQAQAVEAVKKAAVTSNDIQEIITKALRSLA